MSPSDWSRHQPAEVLEDGRAYRFRPEWRPVLLAYLGMAPGMRVLEVCCGPGTLAPYLAEGVAPGTVTGLDLDESFIERARTKAFGVANLDYVVGSAYALPFGDGEFDAVTSYTGIGILGEPERGLAEMIRVCRPGGTVSVMEPAGGAGGASPGLEEAPGAELYPGAAEYRALSDRVGRVEQTFLVPAMRAEQQIGSARWPVASLLGLLGHLGLEQITLDAWGYARSADDARVSPGERRVRRQRDYDLQVARLRWLQEQAQAQVLAREGVPGEDLQRLAELSELRFRWLLEHPLYDWTAGVSLVMAGKKAGGR